MFDSFGFDNSMNMMQMDMHMQEHQNTTEQEWVFQQAVDQHQMMHQQAVEQQEQQRRFMAQQQWHAEDPYYGDTPRKRYVKRQRDPLDIDEVSVPSREQIAAVQSRGLLSEMWHYLKRLCK